MLWVLQWVRKVVVNLYDVGNCWSSHLTTLFASNSTKPVPTVFSGGLCASHSGFHQYSTSSWPTVHSKSGTSGMTSTSQAGRTEEVLFNSSTHGIQLEAKIGHPALDGPNDAPRGLAIVAHREPLTRTTASMAYTKKLTEKGIVGSVWVSWRLDSRPSYKACRAITAADSQLPHSAFQFPWRW